MTTRELPVPEDAKEQRLDLFIGSAMGLSRAKIKALFEEGAIRVDGRTAKKGQTLKPGQKISVRWEESDPAPVPEPEVPLVILHSDDALVFVDKAAGMPSHPLKPLERGTVANALVARFPECTAASTEAREGGLFHRLDQETSGVLCAARTPAAWAAMRAAFTEGAVDKRYWALVSGPLTDEGEIDLPLRHPSRHTDRVEPAADGVDAREARSDFRVLARHVDLALVEVRIHTGVLHQVRAHLAAIGAPIIGDGLYGGRADPALGRFFLHARSLELNHPVTKARLRVESPLPPELESALKRHKVTLPSP